MERVSVVIPTRAGRRWLPACLSSLRAQTFADFDIVVVDDASADGTAEWLATWSEPAVRVIRNERNVGFAAACNVGIRASAAPFVALLNDDTEPSSTWLHELMRAALAASSEKIGAVASLMVFADRPDLTQSAGISMDRAAIAWDRLGGQPVSAAQTPCEIFGASAGAALYRRDMLDEIGFLDERFFMYMEDVDLAWRAQRAGWRCRFAPDARVLHHTSATAGEGSPFKLRLLARNKIWMAAKNASARELATMALYDAMAVALATARTRSLVSLKGRAEGLRRWPEFRRDRVRSRATVQCVEPLASPLAVRRRYAHLRPARPAA